MRFGSLFTGIGGLDLALESFGYECAWQVEIDPYARGVLEHQWPHVQRFPDVRTVGEAELSPVDIICGGYPCQGHSNAGKRLGHADERSGLWGEFARIVRVLRPRYVFVENVAALLARGVGRVLGDLAQIGYDAEWDCLRAADVGAPHLRDRVFILAHAQRGGVWDEPRGVGGPSRQDQAFSIHYGANGDLAHPNGLRLARPRLAATKREALDDPGGCHSAMADAGHEPRARTGSRVGRISGQFVVLEEDGREGADPSRGRGWWEVEPRVGRVANGVPARVDRLRCLGNAVVPAQAAHAWEVLMNRLGHSP